MYARALRLTNIAEHDWQEDQSVRGAEHHDTQVHAEVEHLRDTEDITVSFIIKTLI